MIRDFFEWWLAQLAELFDPILRVLKEPAADATVVSPSGSLARRVDSVSIGVRRKNKETPLCRFDLDGAPPPELSPLPRLPAVLRLAETDILEKTVVLPAATERHLEQVLALEMDRETPFAPDDLYWTYRIEARDRQARRLVVRLIMVPRARLAALSESLARVGIIPRRAEIATGPNRGCSLQLGSDEAARPGNRGAKVLWPLAICFLLLGAAAIVVPFVLQARALAAADREIAGSRAAADEVRRLSAEVAQRSAAGDLIQNERRKAGSALEVIAAATRILPDDAYLTELTLGQRKVKFTGRAVRAARLIGAIAGDGAFRNPELGAPITQVDTGGAEIFTITAEAAP